MDKNKLKKKEIVANIYRKIDSSYENEVIDESMIRSVIDSFFDEVKNGLKARKSIELRGFGTFELKIRKAKEKARNPKTGQRVRVSSHAVAAFRPGRELKTDVWNLKED